MQDVVEEVDCTIKRELGDWLVLNLFCKLVDGHQHMCETP
jgi:hypothetical protein